MVPSLWSEAPFEFCTTSTVICVRHQRFRCSCTNPQSKNPQCRCAFFFSISLSFNVSVRLCMTVSLCSLSCIFWCTVMVTGGDLAVSFHFSHYRWAVLWPRGLTLILFVSLLWHSNWQKKAQSCTLTQTHQVFFLTIFCCHHGHSVESWTVL